LLFVLSTKTTTERFLLKLCQRNRKKKKNRPSWLVSKHCYDVDSSEAYSSSEEDEKVSASEKEAVTATESCNEIRENVESSYSDDSSADEAKKRKSAGKPKPAPSSSTVTKSSKKAPKKSNKRNKSLSEKEMEGLCGQLEVVMRNLHETSTQRAS